ncbi:MAG: dihydroneopterin aldolase family protein [Methanomicrobiales archaeon]|nr:dihydroneopterin aldolase family protein [Methanomicrobiales archaeon]
MSDRIPAIPTSSITSDREEAAFEAGIKLGALYHQFVGTPVSRATAPTLELAMATAARLQPHVEDVRVHLNQELMNPNAFGYTELRGAMIAAEITTQVRTAHCHATLAMENDYPMMKIISFA